MGICSRKPVTAHNGVLIHFKKFPILRQWAGGPGVFGIHLLARSDWRIESDRKNAEAAYL